MPCFHPVKGWRAAESGPSGKRRIVFDHSASCGVEVTLPCGRCVGCRLERSRQWAVRCMHEASMHDDNCFLTLTYSPEFLPSDGSLDKSHFQGFMKRLRGRLGDHGVRYFQCGEYGEHFARPHYHACMFGFDPRDKRPISKSGSYPLFTSSLVDDLWSRGFCSVGALTFESAAYVARYALKKVTGDEAEDHYWRLSPETGELNRVESEYVTMSRRPGIARAWFEEFSNEVMDNDSVIARGYESRPPRYYDKLFEAAHGERFESVKRQRKRDLASRLDDLTEARLASREKVAKARLSLRRRALEGG